MNGNGKVTLQCERLKKLFKNLFLTCLLLAMQYAGLSQSLALVNNTYCNLHFSLGGALDAPCGQAVYVHGSVPGRTTIRWPGPEAVDWNRKAEQIYWKNFALDVNGAIVIGHCINDALFSPVIYLQDCHTDVEYQWNEDPATGNVEIIINAVSLSIPATLSRSMKMYLPHGGTAVIIKAMLDVEALGNKLYVRTNKSFIAGADKINNNIKTTMKLQPLSQTTNYEACKFISVSPSVQQVIFNCFCGMEQVFYLYKDDVEQPSVTTVTEL